MPVSSNRYYNEYHGHPVEHLDEVHSHLRRSHPSVVFLAGDSSLDNKFWFSRCADALNGYEHVLQPPRMRTDVCYWLNREVVQRGVKDLCCLNTAIEATSLNSRACCTLLEQDAFIRDHITANDYLVVSVGGNDIALTPVLCTVLNLLLISWCTPAVCLDRCACACPCNSHLDGGCATCGLPGCITGFPCGWPLGIGYFVDLFKNRVQNYVSRLVSRTKPKKVLVCMIYFLDESVTGSWADGALSCMCYNLYPCRLQAAIRAMFRLATQQIRIPGTEVVAVPLFRVLNGKTSGDYVQRVEPSPEGGRKLAAALMDAILGVEGSVLVSEGPSSSEAGSPSQVTMSSGVE